jgi:hypothetical protein
MCWGKAEYELGVWKGRLAEETPDEEREPRVTWKERGDELPAEEREPEEVLERV